MWSDSDEDIVPILFNFIQVCERHEAQNREWWVHPYNQKRDAENLIKNMMTKLRTYPDKFKNITRMRIETFDYLLLLIQSAIEKQDTNYRKSITPGERLFITLRYLATGETFKSLSYHFRCGASTIGKIVIETCKAIWEALEPTYLPKPDADKWTSIADEFSKMWNFPNCLGAIDGKHIKIRCPPNAGSDYKKCNSIHVQAVADARGQFICVDVDDFEANCDSGVFKHSNFGQKLNNKQLNLPDKKKLFAESEEYFPFVFVADESYPLLTNLLRPFARKNFTNEKRIYNYRLSRARRVVECAFGMLTKRFGIFETTILLPPDKVQIIILAACTLHNMIRERENLLEEIYIEQEAMEDMVQEEKNQNTRPSNAARNIRNQFVAYFNSATGSVPWQYKYAN